jgi:hypothetical protein
VQDLGKLVSNGSSLVHILEFDPSPVAASLAVGGGRIVIC